MSRALSYVQHISSQSQLLQTLKHATTPPKHSILFFANCLLFHMFTVMCKPLRANRLLFPADRSAFRTDHSAFFANHFMCKNRSTHDQTMPLESYRPCKTCKSLCCGTRNRRTLLRIPAIVLKFLNIEKLQITETKYIQ